MSLFQGIFDTTTTTINVSGFLICILAALVIGFFLAGVYSIKNRTTKSFLVTLILLPTIVCAVIMMVNGNVGAGVAVAGAFSLVRFRSAPGSAKDISVIFLAMVSGLMCGMGYIGYAVVFTLILGCLLVVLNSVMASNGSERQLRITVPEDLDYSHEFDDILKQYTDSYHLESVKTTNMGSLFKLTYSITMKNPDKEKRMIDELRIRNGNLEVLVQDKEVVAYDL